MEWRKQIAIASAGFALLGPQLGCSPSTSEPLRSEESTEVRVDTSHSPRLNKLEKEVTKESLELTKKRFEKDDIDISIVEDDADVFMEYATVHKPVNWLLEDYGYTLTDDFAEKVTEITKDTSYSQANIQTNMHYLQASLEIVGNGDKERKGIKTLVTNSGQFTPPNTVYINIPNMISSLMVRNDLENRSLEEMVSRGELHWDISNTEMHEIGHVGGLLHFNQIDREVQYCKGPLNNFMSKQKENINQTYNDEQLRILKKGFEEDSKIQKIMSKNSRLGDLEGYYRKNVDLRAYCK